MLTFSVQFNIFDTDNGPAIQHLDEHTSVLTVHYITNKCIKYLVTLIKHPPRWFRKLVCSLFIVSNIGSSDILCICVMGGICCVLLKCFDRTERDPCKQLGPASTLYAHDYATPT